MKRGNLATPIKLDKKQYCYSTESNNFITVSETPQSWLKQAFSILLLALNVSVFKNSFQHWFIDSFSPFQLETVL